MREGASASWPFVGRELELALVSSDPTRSVVLTGEAGVGKSRLLAEIASSLEAEGSRVVRVAATPSLRDVPLGAFAAVLPRPASGRPFAAMQNALDALAAGASFSDTVLAIDDAHLLDATSAGLAFLAVQSGARVLATVRDGEPCPDEIVRLWKDDFASRVEVAALDEEQMAGALEQALGAPVDVKTLRKLYQATRGNLLFLRELVRHAELTGALVLRGGVWAWIAPAFDAPSVRDLVRDRLRDASDDVRESVDALAIAEPLGRAVLERICSPAVVAEAERVGIVVGGDDARRDDLRLVHPLYGEVIRSSFGATRRATLASQIADALVATGARRRDDEPRIALLQLEAGSARDVSVLEGAAREVGARGDLALAERFARAAIAAGGDAESKLLLGDILYWSGRHDELIELLGNLPEGTSPEVQARATLLVASSLFWGFGRFDEADALLDEGAMRVGEFAPELLGQRGQMLVLMGRGRESIEVARVVLDNPNASGEARLRAYAGYLVASAWCGRLDHVRAELPTAMALVMEARTQLSVYATGGVMIASFLVNLFGGTLEQTDGMATAMHAAALERVDDPLLGTWSFLLGRSALAQGKLGDAIPRLRDAASLLRNRDNGGMLPWALASLAQALGAADDRAGATESIEELDRVRVLLLRHIDVEIELGRAWAASARGERTLARETAERIGRTLLAQGEPAIAAMGLHDALRLGAEPSALVELLETAAAGCDGPVVAAMAAHARALVDEDADALLAAAGLFEGAGRLLHAAECAAGASALAAAQGRRALQRDAATRTAQLSARCGPALTPMLETVAGKQALGSLTRREQEIALMAARGLSKREMAETLCVSVRTVGNHINHVYGKLGISSRDELQAVLGVAQ